MPRYYPRAFCTTLTLLVPLFWWSSSAAAADPQATAESSLTGRLAYVEPSLSRISVLPDGEIYLSELFVDDGSEVRQGDRVLTLSDLVIEVGRRVTVRYRIDGDRRIAVSIIVDPPG